MQLDQILPPPSELVQLQPEDLAPLLLRYLASTKKTQYLNRCSLTGQSGELGTYSGGLYKQVAEAITEAWMVLEREGLIAPKPGDSSGVFVTRRGQALAQSGDFTSFRLGHLLPEKALDANLALKVRSLFLRGDYDTAVFAAFRSVEVAVRRAGKLGDTDIGVALMRKAFAPGSGVLTNKALPKAEQEATAHLFSGAIGLFKNPSNHRQVEYAPEEAADLIRFANYLITWVEQITPGGQE